MLDNATATINPGQKVGLVGKNGCGKSTLLALLKGELSADGGNATFPSNWALAWVNQETPALDVPAIEYVIDGDREYRQLEAELQAANEKMMVMPLQPCTASSMPSTPGPFNPVLPVCYTDWGFLKKVYSSLCAHFQVVGECALTWHKH